MKKGNTKRKDKYSVKKVQYQINLSDFISALSATKKSNALTVSFFEL